MTFLGEIEVSRTPGSRGEWTLVSDLIYIGKWDQFLVPKGFKTDFASIPRIFHVLFPKNGRHDAAAIVHDYLYQKQPFVSSRITRDMKRITRLDSDRIFRRIMKELGVGVVRRNLMYQAVRLGGAIAWSRSRKKLLDG